MAKTAFLKHAVSFFRRFPLVLKVAYLITWRLQPRFTIGVVAVILNPQGQILLAKHAFHHLQWGLPGGWIKRGETLFACAEREVYEEMRLKIRVEQLLATELKPNGHLDVAVLATPLDEVGALSFELLDYGWFDVDSLPPMVEFHRMAVQRYITYQSVMEQIGKPEHGN